MKKKTRAIELRDGKLKIQPGFKLFLVTLPLLIMYFLLCYLPLEGWKYSFYNYKAGYPLEKCEYVGLYHFARMFANHITRRETFRVLKNTFIFSGIGILTSFVPMFFAIFLNEIKNDKFKRVVQTITTLPNFISWVIVFSFALAMFATDIGAVNIVLKKMGIIDQGINYLASKGWKVYLFMWLLSNWKGLGWGSIVYLAALGSIDQELYEAAAVDGAGRFSKIFHITIPGLLPTFVTLLILSIGNFLSTGMDQYLVFMNPFNRAQIEVLDLYVYNMGLGSSFNDYSYATAVGIMKSIVGLALLFFSNSISGKIRGEKIM